LTIIIKGKAEIWVELQENRKSGEIISISWIVICFSGDNLFNYWNESFGA
jgi:hypothetical protein